jgi:hypothetical protein
MGIVSPDRLEHLAKTHLKKKKQKLQTQTPAKAMPNLKLIFAVGIIRPP